MTHANAPLTIEGRRRLVERCRTRPIAHIATEAGVSHACLSKWKNRYDKHGETGLLDRPSVPRSSPTQTPPDGFSRLAYTEHLPDEKAATTVASFSRARAFFAAHGIHRVVRVVTDNGANYRAAVCVHSLTSRASRHQRAEPYRPRHSGKVERYQRILAEELLYARQRTSLRKSEPGRSRSGTSTTTTTGLTPPPETVLPSHASTRASPTSWPATTRP